MTGKNSIKDILETVEEANHQVFFLKAKNREEVFFTLKEKIKNKSISTSENMFLYLMSLDIKTVRNILKENNVSVDKGVKRYILISFFSATNEAQNALLKFLEDTPDNIKVIILTAISTELLATVISRCFILDCIEKSKNEHLLESDQNYDNAVKAFLNTEKKSRVNLPEIKELLVKKDKAYMEMEGKERIDREAIDFFLEKVFLALFKEFEVDLRDGNLDFIKISEKRKILEEVFESLKYLKKNSSSAKNLIEYLSLKIPEIH